MGRMLLGLDIRTDGVCAVFGNRSIKQRRSVSSLSVPIAVSGDRKEALEIALADVSGLLDPADCLCRVALPIETVDFFSLEVPFGDHKKIAQILPFELEPKIPFAPQDLAIDFKTAALATNSEATPVLAAMITKKTRDEYLEVLEGAGFKPESITFGGFSAATRLAVDYELPETALALDLGQQRSACFFLVEKRIVLVRSFALNAAAETAEEKLLDQIRWSLTAFKTTWPDDFDPQAIFITGWPGEAARWETCLAQGLKLPVKPVDFGDENQLIEPLPDEAAAWSPGRQNDALALTLNKPDRAQAFDFGRKSDKSWDFLGDYKKAAITTAALAVLALMMLMASLIVNNQILENRIARLDSRIGAIFQAALPGVKMTQNPAQQMQSALQKMGKVKGAAWADQQTMRVIDILNAISRQIPAALDVELGRISVGPDGSVLSGHTAQFNAVNEIKRQLEKRFSTVNIGSAKTDKATSRVSFKLRINP